MGRGPLHFGHVYVYPPERAAARAALIFCAVVLVLFVFLDFVFRLWELLDLFFVESRVAVVTSSEALRFRFGFCVELDTAFLSGWILGAARLGGMELVFGAVFGSFVFPVLCSVSLASGRFGGPRQSRVTSEGETALSIFPDAVSIASESLSSFVSSTPPPHHFVESAGSEAPHRNGILFTMLPRSFLSLPR